MRRDGRVHGRGMADAWENSVYDLSVETLCVLLAASRLNRSDHFR